MTTPDPDRFTVVTDLTGRQHTFHVQVWPSRASLVDHLEKIYPDGNWRDVDDAGNGVAGAFINQSGFMSNDAPNWLGTIFYNDDDLNIATVVHEAVHAALFAYSCDIIGNHSRARAHINETNETLAYLIGELTAAIGDQLHAGGHYDDVKDAA